MPYIYSAAWRVTKNGETLMRSLPLEFSSDRLASQISDQFMFGEALLINPVTTEGARERTLYLPAGQDWIDFWTGKRVRGGQSINGGPNIGSGGADTDVDRRGSPGPGGLAQPCSSRRL
jgi:alpha-D-xyloside xylohydrolase